MARVVLVLLLMSAPAGAQGFGAPLPVVDLSWITNGMSASLIAVDAVPTVPGDELIVWVPELWVVTIAVQHPARSGYMGMIASPGICYEPWTALQTFGGPTWHFREIGDVTRDGIRDWIWYTESPLRVQVYPGTGGTYCR